MAFFTARMRRGVRAHGCPLAAYHPASATPAAGDCGLIHTNSRFEY